MSDRHNQDFIDAWTWSHVTTGFVAQKVGMSLGAYIAAMAVYEVIEYSMEHPHGHPIFGTKRPESPKNVAGDLLGGLIGYWTASRFE